MVVQHGVRKLLGGNCRVAKPKPEISTFLTHVLGASIVKGYARSDTTGPLASKSQTSGKRILEEPLVKLVSFPEAGKSVLDKPRPMRRDLDSGGISLGSILGLKGKPRRRGLD